MPNNKLIRINTTRRHSMHIGISLFASDKGKSGISQYMINLLKAFEEIDQQNTYTLFLAEEDQHVFQFTGDRFQKVITSNFANKPSVNILWHQTVFAYHLLKHKFDVVFMPAANRRLSICTTSPTVGTIHDLCQFRIGQKYDPYRMFYVQKILPMLAKRLSHIVTPSHCSKDDVVTFYGIPEDRISAVHNGIDHSKYFKRDKVGSLSILNAKYHIQPGYILYLSRLEHPGKNHVRLIEAFSQLKKSGMLKQKLVLVGAPWNGHEKIYEAVKRMDLEKDVIFPGFVEGNDLPHFVSGADLFIYPSLFEGFGIPVIEAMASGIPVACSNTSSLPEIVEDAALLFDPLDCNDIAEKIIAAINDEATRSMLMEKGLEQAKRYTWQAAAKKILTLLEVAGGGKNSQMRDKEKKTPPTSFVETYGDTAPPSKGGD
ncbi:MAG TPA: hypothetical protein DF296_00095 [Candidatus Margulisbacteria bacterium]|nr:hypothetical protein [Candidatus Margulisiibacteriota bacterium]HCT83582.1 hypothetical protein [Candidatus Margulisiibacteriota bacterium]